MTTLLDNEMLVRPIAGTLLHTLWQGVVVVLVLALTLRGMRRAGSNTRYLIACGAMLAFVAGAIATFALLLHAHTPVAATPRVARAPEPVAVVAPLGSHETPPITVPSAKTEVDPSRYIVTAWMSGVVVLAVWHVAGWLLLVRLRRGAPVERFGDVIDRLSGAIGVTRAVRVLEAARVDVPAVFGVLRPVILVPIALLNDLSPQHVEAILAHELAHVRRHDFLVNLLQSAVETVLFYHPATWWISRVIRRERENCCDDIAARVCDDERAYAAALAALEVRRPTSTLRLAPAATTGGDLLDRVRRVLKLPPLPRRVSRSRSLAAAALALACVVLPLLVTAAEAQKPASTQPASPQRFLRILVAQDGLRHDGKPTDVDGLRTLLGAMSADERRTTVLEVAAASPDVTVERFFTTSAALHSLVVEHRLAYLSQVGIAASPATAPATTRAAKASDIYTITGRIARGGTYWLGTRTISLKQALAAAGGPDGGPAPEALLVSVLRRDREGDAERYALTDAPLADVLADKVALVLQPYDLIYVTEKPVKVTRQAAAQGAILPADLAAADVGEYYLEGAVGRGGVYSISGIKVTLKQAIAAAGALEKGRDEAFITIIRRGAGDRERVPVANVRYSELLSGAMPDAYLQPDDVVRVTPEPMEFKPAAGAEAAVIIPADPDAKPAGEYFIDGHVPRTGVYSLTGRKITLKQAIAAAGGLDPGMTDAHVQLIRRSGDRTRAVVENVRVSELLSGAARDAYLQPNDIVRVGVQAQPASAPAAAPATKAAAAAATASLAAELTDVPKGARLEELILQRRNAALLLDLYAVLGSEHPRTKDAQAQFDAADQRIREERAMVAAMPSAHAAVYDTTLREYLRQRRELELKAERVSQSLGPQHPASLNAARDLELQKERINAYVEAMRCQFTGQSDAVVRNSRAIREELKRHYERIEVPVTAPASTRR